MPEKTLTCVVCPLGCNITVKTDDDGNITDITGQSCKRGEAYARTEITDPRRTLTTTVRIEGADRPVVPVKSSAPIQKYRLLDCMRAIDAVRVSAPVHIGDVLVRNILDTGIDIIATDDMERLL